MHNLSTNLGIYYQFTWTRTQANATSVFSGTGRAAGAHDPSLRLLGPHVQPGGFVGCSQRVYTRSAVQAGGDNVWKEHAYCARERHDP
jgi:hypothetical protein